MRVIFACFRIAFFSYFAAATAALSLPFQYPKTVIFAGAVNQSRVDLRAVSCLLVDPQKIVFRRQPYDTASVIELTERIFSIRPTLSSLDQCSWGLFITVVKNENFGVSYRGNATDALIAIGICEWLPSIRNYNPNKCLSKNIYVFKRGLSALELFEVGLRGLKNPQSDEWQIFEEKVGE